MHLICHLSGHAVPAAALENQGFRFSRCMRCKQDMIQSSRSNDASWKPVPAGFKVAWRNVDQSIFARQSRLVAQIVAARRNISGLASVAGVGFAVARLALGDRIFRARRRLSGGMAENRIKPIAAPAGFKRRWNLVVHITVDRAMTCEPTQLAA